MFLENTQQDALWYEAQRGLWHQRRHARPGADIWHLRFHWQTEDEFLWRRVQEGTYRLTPMQVFRGADGKGLARWSSPDALVLKWCALHIDGRLPVHDRCEHRRGNGGYVTSVRKVREALETEAYQYVFRTDIRGYYRNIRKKQLWLQVSRFVTDRRLLALIEQYLWYSVEDGGEFRTPEKGIPRGCSLSPLMGASLLYHIDCGFSNREGIYYARYMDDFLILTQTRWQLRRCIAQLNESLDVNGFDWLGAWFEPGAAGLAPRSLRLHR